MINIFNVSAEVESIISDGGPDCGMPMVEDGLSSSQGSDIEDAATLDTNQPAEILKRRHKAGVDSELAAGTDDQSSKVRNFKVKITTS